MIGLAHTPQAMFRMMTGDVKQCSPIVQSKEAYMSKDDSKKFTAQFGYQLALAMPHETIKRLETSQSIPRYWERRTWRIGA